MSEGLQAPETVRKATGAYRSEMDVLGAFLQECCELGDEHNEAAKDLYTAYDHWCKESGERPETKRKFGSRLTERGGLERYRGGSDGGHRWRGVRLLTFWKSAISRDSDPSDVKVTIGGKKLGSRGVNGKLGSEGSEGSANGEIRSALLTFFKQHPEARQQTPAQIAEDLYLWTDLGYTPAAEDVTTALEELGR